MEDDDRIVAKDGYDIIVKSAHCNGDGQSAKQCCLDYNGITATGWVGEVCCCTCGGSGVKRV